MAKVGLHRRQLSLPKFRKWTQCKWNTQFSYLELEALPFRQGSYLFKTMNYVYGTEIVRQVSLQRRWLFWPTYRKWTRRESNTQLFDLESHALPLSHRSYFFKACNTYMITKLWSSDPTCSKQYSTYMTPKLCAEFYLFKTMSYIYHIIIVYEGSYLFKTMCYEYKTEIVLPLQDELYVL